MIVFSSSALFSSQTTKAFLPAMLEKDHGHIVTIASLAGHVGIAKLVDYCSSKFAAVGFDEALRLELEILGSNVQTTCVCPFFIQATGMFEDVNSRWVLGTGQPLTQTIFFFFNDFFASTYADGCQHWLPNKLPIVLLRPSKRRRKLPSFHDTCNSCYALNGKWGPEIRYRWAQCDDSSGEYVYLVLQGLPMGMCCRFFASYCTRCRATTRSLEWNATHPTTIVAARGIGQMRFEWNHETC